MKKERFYYAVASFMQKDGTITVSAVTHNVRGGEEATKFYPLMFVIDKIEEKFSEIAVHGTVIVHSIVEISKQDYDAYNERAKLNKEKEG